ncbi:tyrosine-type recombinase/integrase [Methylobacter svalbardensis]|uniref:tyrosine-type recombinase/integrase n=1 Tax=Methylobacter svalbardensis TaxID=3080016 RepID=UPI0030EF9D8A
MSKRIPGLQYDKDAAQWSVDKRIKGHGRLRKRLRASTKEEAEIEFYNIISNLQATVVRRDHGLMTFREAGLKYIGESTKKSFSRDIHTLKAADPFLKDLTLNEIHNETLKSFILARKEAGLKSSTVIRDIAVIRGILRLAVNKWRTVDSKPYLLTAPLFDLPKWDDAGEPYPLNKKAQLNLFRKLPKHLRRMAFFAINTGLRVQSICWLRWDWEVEIPELNASIFLTPGKERPYADGIWPGEKNKEDQIVVLNKIAKAVIDVQRRQRKDNCPYVFPFKGKRIGGMNNSGWKNAWVESGLPVCKEVKKGPHNLKHTFGRRLRNAGVHLETRKVLLHHTNHDVTTLYSPADVLDLLTAAEKAVEFRSTTFIARQHN